MSRGTAVVAGGASGLGVVVARCLVKVGRSVVLVGRDVIVEAERSLGSPGVRSFTRCA